MTRIEVKGLRELHAKLGRFDRELPRTVDNVLKDAAQLVVDDAKRRIPLGPPKGGHAQSSVRSAKIGAGRREVRAGGARYPYYGWLEYGGHVGRRKRTARAKVADGRYLNPAFAAKRDQVRRVAERGIARAIRAAGLGRGGI
jgi:hypothetical protein